MPTQQQIRPAKRHGMQPIRVIASPLSVRQ